MNRPVFYSFRRCPYAMRARMALYYAGVDVELREILLRNKPKAMLEASPKGTVPVLVLDDTVIDESLEIMSWELQHSDPQQWLAIDPTENVEAHELVRNNDNDFKSQLDKYKYADRHPEFPAIHYRRAGEVFLDTLNQRLRNQPYLFGVRLSYADVAIFPFVRQFAHVDKEWFEQSSYQHLVLWLQGLIQSDLFVGVMQKYPQWITSGESHSFP